jgi:formylglycine-generating enzyme required for sulfatase activity
MKIEFRIDAPRGGIRRLLLFFGLPVALIAAAALLARAYDDSWIKSGATIDAATLKAMFDEIQARQAGTAPCPVGYTQDNSVVTYTVCMNGADEMVKVGSGLSSFWIDRYEASIWDSPAATGTQYGAFVNDYPVAFAQNGQRGTGYLELYAVSKLGVTPSDFTTWFQAQNACRASGKRLPTDEEWLYAASGTHDPGSDNGSSNGHCVTSASGPSPRPTGGANVADSTACVSAWGAQDMIGNLQEWTASWYAGLGWPASAGATGQQVQGALATWPSGYNGDGVWNVASSAMDGSGTFDSGIPAAAGRGGGFGHGTHAGVFATQVQLTPGAFFNDTGFRCVIH